MRTKLLVAPLITTLAVAACTNTNPPQQPTINLSETPQEQTQEQTPETTTTPNNQTPQPNPPPWTANICDTVDENTFTALAQTFTPTPPHPTQTQYQETQLPPNQTQTILQQTIPQLTTLTDNTLICQTQTTFTTTEPHPTHPTITTTQNINIIATPTTLTEQTLIEANPNIPINIQPFPLEGATTAATVTTPLIEDIPQHILTYITLNNTTIIINNINSTLTTSNTGTTNQTSLNQLRNNTQITIQTYQNAIRGTLAYLQAAQPQ